MTNAHVTLTGRVINLSNLTAEEKTFLDTMMSAYEANEAYNIFVNRFNAPYSLALGGKQWLTEEVANLPIYQVCEDLADRLGIMQGYLSLGENSSNDQED